MTYGATVLGRSPDAYLPLNASDFADSSGNGHDGTTLDAHVFVGGGDGPITGDLAVKMANSSTNHRISLASPASLPGVGAFTYEWWVRFDPQAVAGDYFDMFVSLQDGGGHLNGSISFQIWSDAGTGLYAVVSTEDDIAFTGTSSSTPEVSANQFCWHHWVLVSDGTTAIVYKDGVAQSVDIPIVMPSSALTPFAFRIEASISEATVGYCNQFAVYSTALTGTQVNANYAAATPRQDSSCFLRAVRLKHASGPVCWQHDSKTWRVNSDGNPAQTHDGTTQVLYSGTTPVLQTPFPVHSSSTDTYLGLDATSGLPVVAPLPKIVTLPPPVVTPSGSTCAQVRCGAANKLGDRLSDIYHTVEQWVDTAATGLLAAFFTALAGTGFSLLDFVTDGLGLVLTADEIALVATIDRAIGVLTVGVLGDVAPFLNNDQITWLKQAAFDSLVCTGDTVQFDGAQMDAWYNRVLHASGTPPGFGFIQQEVLYAILGWGRDLALADWAATAQTGANSPSTMCDSWS